MLGSCVDVDGPSASKIRLVITALRCSSCLSSKAKITFNKELEISTNILHQNIFLALRLLSDLQGHRVTA